MPVDTSLSTRVDLPCPRCQEANYRLVEPTDILAVRPFPAPVECPACGKRGMVYLTDRGPQLRTGSSPFPAESGAAIEAASRAAGLSLRPKVQTLTGLVAESRYSLTHEQLDAPAEDAPLGDSAEDKQNHCA